MLLCMLLLYTNMPAKVTVCRTLQAPITSTVLGFAPAGTYDVTTLLLKVPCLLHFLQAKRDLPMLMMTPAGKAMARAVNDRIGADGCTALHDGLLTAVKEHRMDVKSIDASDCRRVRSVFLCTDGLPNVG